VYPKIATIVAEHKTTSFGYEVTLGMYLCKQFIPFLACDNILLEIT
jgi:hypothetical protein